MNAVQVWQLDGAGADTAETRQTAEHPREILDDVWQVILYNDDVNGMDHVVRCLMRVFGHSMALAVKIMAEAHNKGRAIAEVEAETDARLHRDQLGSFGLTATIERVQ